MNRVRIGSGLVGATSVAALNYLAARYLPGAPRLDVLGLQLTTTAFKKLGIHPPGGLPAKVLALLGSLASNSMFYGLVGLGAPKTAWLRGGALGLAMGLGVLTLSPAFGVGKRETGRTPTTKAGTLIWYILGGILAALTFMASHEHEGKFR
ncbi:MAG: hypothetical protein ABW346_01910 [Terrimicrobium sp.]